MEQRSLGGSGLRVSRLGLGTLTWGRDTDEHEARDQLRMFLDAGGTLIDTAMGYGDGAAEELIGQLLDEGNYRDDVVLATKAGISQHHGQRSVDTSRGALLKALDRSLARLGTDHVDLWQVSVWSDHTPWDETLEALDTAVRTGRASYIGISNYTAWQAAQAATWQKAVPGRQRLVCHQTEYSLLHRAPEHEILPCAEALGLGVLAWAPLGRGVLTGKYRTGTPADSRAASPHLGAYASEYLDSGSARIVEATARAAEGLGWSALEVALAWVRDRPGVTSALLGARTAAQLKGALSAEECVLPSEIRHALDDVSQR